MTESTKSSPVIKPPRKVLEPNQTKPIPETDTSPSKAASSSNKKKAAKKAEAKQNKETTASSPKAKSKSKKGKAKKSNSGTGNAHIKKQSPADGEPVGLGDKLVTTPCDSNQSTPEVSTVSAITPEGSNVQVTTDDVKEQVTSGIEEAKDEEPAMSEHNLDKVSETQAREGSKVEKEEEVAAENEPTMPENKFSKSDAQLEVAAEPHEGVEATSNQITAPKDNHSAASHAATSELTEKHEAGNNVDGEMINPPIIDPVTQSMVPKKSFQRKVTAVMKGSGAGALAAVTQLFTRLAPSSVETQQEEQEEAEEPVIQAMIDPRIRSLEPRRNKPLQDVLHKVFGSFVTSH